MKKCFMAAIAILALQGFAANEKVLAVKLAGSDKMMQAVMKFGELTGNPMAGAMLSGFVQELTYVKFFGPMREGAAATMGIYADTATVNIEDLGKLTKSEKLARAVAYPIAGTKASFLALHPKSVEKDGVIKVTKGPGMDVIQGKKELFVAFSRDGRWVAVSDRPAIAKAAVSDVKFNESGVGEDIARVYVTQAGVKMLRNIADLAVKKGEEMKAGVERIKAMSEKIKKISFAGGAVAIGDKGIDLKTIFVPEKGSDLALLGKKGTIDPVKMLSAAPANAVFASAFAPGMYDLGKFCGSIDELRKIFSDNGIDTGFFKHSLKGGHLSMALDVEAAIAYFGEGGKGAKAIEKMDDEAFDNSMMDFLERLRKTYVTLNKDAKAGGSSLVISSVKPKASPAAIYRKVMSDVPVGDGVVSAVALSAANTAKAILGLVFEKSSEPEMRQLKMLLSSVPENPNGGLCTMLRLDKGKVVGMLRISSAELKTISSFANIAMAASMSKAASGMSFEEDDDDDDD